MNSILNAWDKFWFSRNDTIQVGIFRIFFGLQLFFFFLFLYFNWNSYYRLDGIRSLIDLDKVTQDYYGWSLFSMTESWLPVKTFWYLGIISSIMFTLGWQTRIATILLFLIICSMIHRSPFVTNGEDLVFRMLLFHGIFAPLGHSLSIDAYLKKRRNKTHPVAKKYPMIWAVRTMQINFIFIYINSLPHKIADDVAWQNGDAIYLTMVGTMWSRGFWPELTYIFDGLFSKIGTFGTILIEGLAPFLIWFKRTWLIAVFSLASLHLGIAILLNGVAFFSISMLAPLVLFIPSKVVYQLLGKFNSNYAIEFSKSNTNH